MRAAMSVVKWLDKKLFSHAPDFPWHPDYDKTYKLSPIYVVCILNFNIRPEDEDDLRDGADEAHRCRTMLEKIAFVFRLISSLRDRPEGFAERFFLRVFEKANAGP